MMKNCELAEFGSCARAMPTTPRTKCAFLENSAGRSGSSEPPVPTASGSKPFFMSPYCDVAGLRHEAVDDAMEGDIVVGAFAHQLLDLLDMLRRKVGPQRDRHVAVLQRDDHGVFRVGRARGERRGEQNGEDGERRSKLPELH